MTLNTKCADGHSWPEGQMPAFLEMFCLLSAFPFPVESGLPPDRVISPLQTSTPPVLTYSGEHSWSLMARFLQTYTSYSQAFIMS